MAVFQIKNVKVVGMTCCVPTTIDRNEDNPQFTREECDKLIATIGVKEKRIADPSICTSDLCFQAAEKMLQDMNINRSEIDCLFFISQTPDYILPATSCILQERLNLSKECHTIDISLGCSGWVYGLSSIASLISAGKLRKGLLLVGDTTSKTTHPKDKSSWPLFGDAGTATLLEYDEESNGFTFHTATDGSGASAIMIPDGGYRNPFSVNSLVDREYQMDSYISNVYCKLEGMDVFSFAISKAPKSVKTVLDKVAIDKDEIDYFLFHQANLFLNETIRKKLKLREEQVPYSIDLYGNTSCASIPQTMCAKIYNQLENNKLKIVACGFGVGLSWASVFFETDNIYCPNIFEYHE